MISTCSATCAKGLQRKHQTHVPQGGSQVSLTTCFFGNAAFIYTSRIALPLRSSICQYQAYQALMDGLAFGFLSQQNRPHTDRPKFRQAHDSSHDVTDFNGHVLLARESFPHKKSGIDKKGEVGEIDKTLAMNGSAQVFVPQVNPK